MPIIPALLVLVGSISFLSHAAEGTYGVYASKDQGRFWFKADVGLPPDKRINAFAATQSTIIAGTDAGIYVTTNNAKSWARAPVQFSGPLRVICVATLGNRAFAGTSDGLLFVSEDGGASWHRDPTFPHQSVRSLYAMGETLYAGVDLDSVYRSADQGSTWTHLAAGLPARSQVLALTSVEGHIFAGLYGGGLYTWSEVDQKWLRLAASANIRPLVLGASGGRLIAGHNPGGIYWSDDLGQTWTHWTQAISPTDSTQRLDLILEIPAQSFLEAPIWEMAADEKVVIAGAADGIYYSKDRGRTWTRSANGLPQGSPGVAFLARPGFILAAVSGKQASCSESANK